MIRGWFTVEGFIHSFIHPSIHSSTQSLSPTCHPITHPPIHLPIHSSIRPSIHPFTHPSNHHLSTHPSIHPSLIHPSIHAMFPMCPLHACPGLTLRMSGGQALSHPRAFPVWGRRRHRSSLPQCGSVSTQRLVVWEASGLQTRRVDWAEVGSPPLPAPPAGWGGEL